MKGFIGKALSAVFFTTGLMSSGCNSGYRDVVDPCWPDRYCAVAKKEANDAMAPQVQNGHILNQTVWAYHFEPKKATLTRGGQEHLETMVRRRPTPDSTIYLATARTGVDVFYNEDPAKFVEERRKLDLERQEAVKKFAEAQTAGRNLSFDVVTHDPSVRDISGVAVYGPMATSARISGIIPLNNADFHGAIRPLPVLGGSK